jgi:hypothetical protein
MEEEGSLRATVLSFSFFSFFLWLENNVLGVMLFCVKNFVYIGLE